jgi:hypothetical protein
LKQNCFRINHGIRVVSFFALFLGLSPARAIDLNLNGFASVHGLAPLNDENYLPTTDARVDFVGGTRFGVNLRADIDPKWTLMSQILATGQDPPRASANADWKLRTDWIYVTFAATDSLVFRFGRQLYPNYLVSEFIDASFAYPWREPPFAVYGLSPFKSFNGASAEYHFDLGGAKSWSAMIYGGNEKITKTFGAADASFNINHMFGTTLTLEGDGWRVRGMVGRESIDAVIDVGLVTVTGPVGTPYYSHVAAPSVLAASLGGRYDRNQIVLYGEYGYRGTDQGTPEAGTGKRFFRRLAGYYGTAGYRLGSFLPRYTYGHADWRLGISSTDGILNTHNFGLNYQVNPWIVAKAEYSWQKAEGGTVTRLQRTGIARTASLGIDLIF